MAVRFVEYLKSYELFVMLIVTSDLISLEVTLF